MLKVFDKPRHLTDQKCQLSPLNTHQHHINHIVHNLLNLCSNRTTFKLLRTRIENTQFAVFISDIPVTLQQSQSHQTYRDHADPKQGYAKHAKKNSDLVLIVS